MLKVARWSGVVGSDKARTLAMRGGVMKDDGAIKIMLVLEFWDYPGVVPILALLDPLVDAWMANDAGVPRVILPSTIESA